MKLPCIAGARARGVAVLLALAALLPACGGGGGEDGGVGTGGTGSLSLGPISGFGSIFVNGVRFDDDSARVLDADGLPSRREALALGMVVEVEGEPIAVVDGIRTARATTIRFGSELLGPVEAVSGDGFVVLGQPVRATAATAWANAAGPSSLRAGDVVEVYGFPSADPRRAYVATRVEVRGAADRWIVRGVVRESRPEAARFRIGGISVDMSGAPSPSRYAPPDGTLVRVRVLPVPRAPDGAYLGDLLRVASRALPDRDDVEIEGLVTAFESATRFSVDGVPVDASALATPPRLGPEALGRRVEVEGRLRDGTLVATEVEIEDDLADDDGASTVVSGRIASLDRDARGFTVGATRVRWNDATAFDDGSVAGLADGRPVEVTGRPQPDGTLLATEIEFDG
jgi:hypothetical protein